VSWMSELPHVRVSDADRERAASALREHFAQGRLDADEFEERLTRAYAARTVNELETLGADLPRLPATGRTELAERRATLTRHLVQQTGASLVPFGICTVIWLATGTNGGFWPVWILIVALIPLLRNGWRLYGPAPDLDHVERALKPKQRQLEEPPG
jgi:Domain of unknown function (DUF1707)